MKSLYVHIPFCEYKCFYCSFVVAVGQERAIDRYLDCLQQEMQSYRSEKVKTIYFGGGTPALISAEQMRRLCELIHKHFSFQRGIEWTVEANPESLSAAKLGVMKGAGVNRISLGVQTLNDKYLHYLGRKHDARSAQDAFRKIRDAGYDNVSIDMMLSFPGQTAREIREDVGRLIQMQSDHFSLYSLSIEENSRFYTRNVALQSGHSQARHYRLVCDILCNNGYEQYEVSNFAKPAKASLHNLNYWQGGHYIGLGVGAHSYLGSTRSWNVSRLQEYFAHVEKKISAQEGYEKLSPYDQMKERLLFGLRMNQGVELETLAGQYGCFPSDEQLKKIDDFVRGGFLVRRNGCLRASAKGRMVLDELCAQLV